MPLPPQGAGGHRPGQAIQQRGRAQGGAVADPQDREVLGRLQVDLVDEHPGAVRVGQPDPHPGQADHGIGVLLEPDPVTEPQPPGPRGVHRRSWEARCTRVSVPSGAVTRSAVSSCCQSRW